MTPTSTRPPGGPGGEPSWEQLLSGGLPGARKARIEAERAAAAEAAAEAAGQAAEAAPEPVRHIDLAELEQLQAMVDDDLDDDLDGRPGGDVVGDPGEDDEDLDVDLRDVAEHDDYDDPYDEAAADGDAEPGPLTGDIELLRRLDDLDEDDEDDLGDGDLEAVEAGPAEAPEDPPAAHPRARAPMPAPAPRVPFSAPPAVSPADVSAIEFDAGPVLDPADAAQLRDLEDRVAHVLRHPENLRSVHQPLVDLRTGDCAGFGAVVRVAEWPARDPRPWLHAAERTGLAARLEAASLAASLRARMTMPGDRITAVGLSATSLADPAVLRVLEDEDDLARVLVVVSPAEDVARPGPAADAFARLRERRTLLAIRVAEAGRSELAAVQTARPDVVVLERPFAVDLDGDAGRQRLVRTVAELARELGGAVLAEGVEAVPDALALQACGVRLGQGWLLGRARPGFLLPPREATGWLREAWDSRRNTAPRGIPRQRPSGTPADAPH